MAQFCSVGRTHVSASKWLQKENPRGPKPIKHISERQHLHRLIQCGSSQLARYTVVGVSYRRPVGGLHDDGGLQPARCDALR